MRTHENISFILTFVTKDLANLSFFDEHVSLPRKITYPCTILVKSPMLEKCLFKGVFLFVCSFSSSLADQVVFIMENHLNKIRFYYSNVDLEQIYQLFFRMYTCIVLWNDRF